MRGRPRRPQHGSRNRPAGPRPPVANQPDEAAGQPGIRRKCVLVVEDNATVGGLLVALLREEGYRALRAWDTEDAMKMARDRKPDMIALDLSLPYQEGVPALATLKENPDTREAPLLLVAGNGVHLATEERAMVDEFVAKPFDIDRLLNAFRRLMGEPEQDVPQRNYATTDSHLNSW